MLKRLHCLFLISLLGSASIANSEPNAGDEVAKAMSSKDEELNNEKKAQSEDKIDVSYPSLRQGQVKYIEKYSVKLLGHFIFLVLVQYAMHDLADHSFSSPCLNRAILRTMIFFYLPKGIKHVVERFSNRGKKIAHVVQKKNKKVTKKSKALRWISTLVLNMLIMIPIFSIMPKEEDKLSRWLLVMFEYYLYDLMNKVVKYIAEKLAQSEKGKRKQATQKNKILKSVLEFIAYMLVYLAYGYLMQKYYKGYNMFSSLMWLVMAYSYDMMSYVVNKGYAISPLTSFSEDITNHPVLWVGYSAWSIVASFLKLRAAEWILGHIDTIPDIARVKEPVTEEAMNLAIEKSIGLQSMCIVLFLSLGLDTLLSLLTASSASHWHHEGQKGEDPILPSFKDRFWRSFRFMFSLSAPIPIISLLSFSLFEVPENETHKKIALFLPCIIAILSYVGITFYDAKKRQKEDTKVINKKDPVLDPQDKSLDVMKPLVA